LPSISDDLPSEMKSALAVRREATLTGACECGATFSYPSQAERREAQRQGQPLHCTMEHEEHCRVTDDGISEIAARFGIRLGWLR